MSFDLAIWYPHEKVTDEEAGQIHLDLCDEKPTRLKPHPSILDFYQELTSLHPEIDDVPEDRLGDLDFCPWSVEFDRSDSFILLCAVWPRAEYVSDLILRLADKHGLAVYDPQIGHIFYPSEPLRDD